MKEVWWRLLVLGGVLALSVPGLRAQPGGYGGGRGPGAGMTRIYNPQTVESITGAVVKVERVAPAGGMGQGVHLLVKTDKETMAVHLGPAWYLDNQELQIKPQDQVEVTGSRVTVAGEPALIASEVKDGGAVLRLRDEQGMPAWAGWRRGGAGAPGGMMSGGGSMGTNRMMMRQEMMQQHEKMMAEMKAMDADMEQKVQRMNQAQGQAQVEAMAGVINDLVKEQQVMHQHMSQMHQHMMSHMQSMSPGSSGSAPESGSGASGGGSSPGVQ